MTQPSAGQSGPYPQPGEVLDGKYRIERVLGEGGMGAVAKATHLIRRAPVALKFMSPAVMSMAGAVDRFVNEGVAASQIDSDHVVKVFDVGRLPSGSPYLVMEFLDGQDLSDLLARAGGRLDVPRAVHLTLQILRALQVAHAAGIIHRDMKPSNCFIVTKDGEPDFVKLVDFGISKVRAADDGTGAGSANLTRTNSALGTPLYMSPEQARSPRDVDHRTDLYSVGAILYECLTGTTPYTAESGQFTEILFKIFTTDPAPIRSLRPDLPEGLAAVVHRALARDLNVRFASAAAMAEALTPYSDDRSGMIVVRFLGGRAPRPSLPPATDALAPPPQSVVPPRIDTRATADEATARTMLGDEALRPPKVPTDVGMTRETGAGVPPTLTTARGGGFSPFWAAIGLGIVVAGGVGAFVAFRGRHGGSATGDPSATIAPAPTPPAPSTAASLPPLLEPSAVPSGAASQRTVVGPKPSSAPRPSAAGTTPQLRDVGQLHL